MLNQDVPWSGRGKNFQSFEFGLDPWYDDDDYIEKQLDMIKTDFDLVLISDYYFESLVLLKNELCMDWSDMYVPPTKIKDYNHLVLSETQVTQFEQFFKQDVRLFREFNTTFWARVETYGKSRMEADVRYLKLLYLQCAKNPLLEQCSSKGADSQERGFP